MAMNDRGYCIEIVGETGGGQIKAAVATQRYIVRGWSLTLEPTSAGNRGVASITFGGVNQASYETPALGTLATTGVLIQPQLHVQSPAGCVLESPLNVNFALSLTNCRANGVIFIQPVDKSF